MTTTDRPGQSANDGLRIVRIDAKHPDFPLAATIRRRVFVEEQGVAESDEWDDMDGSANHLLAFRHGDALGTLRYYNDSGWLHVGRVAVLPAARGLGLGRLLLAECLRRGSEEGFKRSFLNAQCDKTVFYQKLGYEAVGAVFDEAGIPHIRMERHW